MSVGSILSAVGRGVENTGKAAGDVLLPVAQRLGLVLSGEAPQADDEMRRWQMQQQSESQARRAQFLQNQLMLDEKYGTLHPDQRQAAVDELSRIGTPQPQPSLWQKMMQSFHPNGAVKSVAAPAYTGNAAPPMGTQIADQQIKSQAMAQALGMRQAGMDESIDRRAQDEAANRVPKPLKSMVAGKVFLGVADPNTGTTYPVTDLQPGGSAPPEAKAMYQEYVQGQKDQQEQKDKDWKRENDAIMKREEIAQRHSLDRQTMAFDNALSMGGFRSANATIQGLEKQYATALEMEKRMKLLAGQAFVNGRPNQQAQLALLANHILMTTHQQGSSMRPTKQLFDEASASQPWLDKIQKTWDADGYLSGVVLTPEQVRQMVDLAPVMVNGDLQALTTMKQKLADQLNPQPASTGKKAGAKSTGDALRAAPKAQPSTSSNPFDAFPTN